MIRMRIDDVMWNTSKESKYNEPEAAFRRVRAIHEWCNDSGGKMMHIPTVLCRDIDEWPEVVEWMRHETISGKMEPQIHGWEHIDYGNLTVDECVRHLKLCLDWFKDTLWHEPTIWATPWGADSPSIREAARKLYLKVETTRFTIEPGPAMKRIRQHGNANILRDVTLMDHWWKKGLNIYRIAEVCKHGSYAAAIEFDKANRGKPNGLDWKLFDWEENQDSGAG